MDEFERATAYAGGKSEEILPEHDTEIKVCKGCGESKPLSEFHRNKNRADGRENKCKTCVKNREEGEQVKLKMPDPNRHPLNLSADRIREIRQRRASGGRDSGIRVIADHFGLPWTVVHDILVGWTYADIED